jgi:nucleoside-diphosphate-sugar epimerase
MIGLRFSNVMDSSAYADFPSFENDPASRKWNLWSYIDARDGAQAVVRALAYEQPGFDNFVIANADTVMSRPSTELMAEFFPDVEFRSPVDGTQSLCSIDKARGLLGWEPQHSWRDGNSG